MNTEQMALDFLQGDYKRNMFIEPNIRIDFLKKQIVDIINNYKPGTIVKAGIGNKDLMKFICEQTDAYIVIVEPSLDAIIKFKNEFFNNDFMKNIAFINGNFHNFPADYYAADLLISLDYLQIIESSGAIDEFRRAIEFEGLLLFGMPVLHEDDLDGVYDEYLRISFPLHKDLYLAVDLKTIFDLNEFDFIKGEQEIFEINFSEREEFFEEKFSFDDSYLAEKEKYTEEHKNDLQNFYTFSNNTLSEPYYLGLFKRRKLDSKMEGKII